MRTQFCQNNQSQNSTCTINRIWNDYLLPYLVLGTDNKTLPVAIQLAMQGAYGSTDYGGFMAMLVLAIVPIIIFYVFCQKYIIRGVVAGAVKG